MDPQEVDPQETTPQEIRPTHRPLPEELADKVSNARILLGSRVPFFGHLLFGASVYADPDVLTAATDGASIFFAPKFAQQLDFEEFVGVLVHEVLHMALLHLPRREERKPRRWNIAADMVINEILDEEGFVLPAGPVRFPENKPEWKGKSVEEVYELIKRDSSDWTIHESWIDLEERQQGRQRGDDSEQQSNAEQQSDKAKKWKQISSHWKQVVRRAHQAQRMSGQGSLAKGLKRRIDKVTRPQIGWRRALWRFLVKTPVDFDQFDRRYIHRGLYLKALQADALNLYVAIDTSASIADEHIQMFMGELSGILRSYPHIQAEVYFADAELYGPYQLTSRSSIADFPTPEGGGGTSFVPFFDAVDEKRLLNHTPVAVYLTDGYGDFPESPSCPVLWIRTPGGLESEQFPFGRVLTLSRDYQSQGMGDQH